MKRITLLLIAPLIYLSSFAQQNDFPEMKKNAVKVNLLSPIFNAVNIAYQRTLTPERSLQLGFVYMDFNDFGSLEDRYSYVTNEQESNTKGINLILDYKINLSGYGLNGFYAGPFVRYMNYTREITIEDEYYDFMNSLRYDFTYTEKRKVQSTGIGFLFGKQFLFRNTITLDVFAGPVYQFVTANSRSVSYSSNNPSTPPALSYPTDGYIADSFSDNYIRGYGLRAGFNVGIAF